MSWPTRREDLTSIPAQLLEATRKKILNLETAVQNLEHTCRVITGDLSLPFEKAVILHVYLQTRDQSRLLLRNVE